MPFTNQIAHIEKTMPRVLDQVLVANSVTETFLTGGVIKLDFLDAKTVKVFKLATTPLTPYARGGHGAENQKGAVTSATEVFELEQQRWSAIPIDKLDSLDDGETVIGRTAEELYRTQIVPELDTYRLSKIASYASKTMGNLVEGDIGPNEIVSKFNEAFEWMTEMGVPNEDQIIYVSPKVMTLLRGTSELARRLLPKEMADVNYTVETYEGREIVVVQSDRFYTEAKVGNGIFPTANSKAINFMVVSKSAPIVVKKLDFAKLYSSDDHKLDYVGYELQNLIYHDVFIPDNKTPGIYVSVSTAKGKGRELAVNAVPGTAGKTKVAACLTKPAGMYFDRLAVHTADGNAPAIGSAYASGTEVAVGGEFTPNATHNIFVATADGKVVGVSKDFANTLPKGV